MVDPALPLKTFKKENEFLVAIDSDGCAFDTMEVKHKECFIPNTINYWNLQPVSKFAREAAEFVNLYSEWRGINRFPALIKVIDLVSEREEALKRGFQSPQIESLRRWAESETKLSNPELEKAVKQNSDAVLQRALKWSTAINEAVANMVRGVPPYPYVRESLAEIGRFADMIVVSATPGEALKREWQEHDIAKYVKVIAGQEMGTKKEHLTLAKQNRYEDSRILMIGDALGDLKAAQANHVLFYPINPGDEDASWRCFYEKACDKFFNGQYAGAYEEQLIAKFRKYLPSIPPWKIKRCGQG